MKFSTPDNDNAKIRNKCAATRKSGWWYNNCAERVNINQGIPFVHSNVILTEMKIRPRRCIT